MPSEVCRLFRLAHNAEASDQGGTARSIFTLLPEQKLSLLLRCNRY
jgi:hypothetical protein